MLIQAYLSVVSMSHPSSTNAVPASGCGRLVAVRSRPEMRLAVREEKARDADKRQLIWIGCVCAVAGCSLRSVLLSCGAVRPPCQPDACRSAVTRLRAQGAAARRAGNVRGGRGACPEATSDR